MEENGEWGTNIEIHAFAYKYNCHIRLISMDNSGKINITNINENKNSIYYLYYTGSHYESFIKKN